MTRAKIELGDVTPHNIKQLKKLNTVVFPVSYNDKFYKDVLEAGELAKLAYYNDIVVGAVCCRIDTSENSRRLYIMTLGCLYPYRRLGIGTLMVEHVLKYVEQDGNFDSIFLQNHRSKRRHSSPKMYSPCTGQYDTVLQDKSTYGGAFTQHMCSVIIKTVDLLARHVQVNNEGAIDFYKRFGFEIVETKEHYYKRIEPADAHVLQKTIRLAEAAPLVNGSVPHAKTNGHD